MRNFIQPEWPAPPQIKAYTSLRSGWSDLSFPEEPIWVQQTHSTIVIEATPENKEKKADATFTPQANRVCVVVTADCLPVLICNQQATHVAAIHAGWRGLANGIIETTLQAIQQPAEDLLVWLGPAIGPQKFEVGQDVYEAFTLKHAESATAFVPHTEGKWLADLYELARIRLKQQGVSRIYGGNFCTYTQEDLFFSYRRDKGNTGRLASFIWRTP
ncbi:MAG: peptidoglycan editing factor PgeF [Gammaproteobacteria bacterium]|nr:MAG: peptidoglycan editing factor PgeF [Gammaproteobacteria bacterium]